MTRRDVLGKLAALPFVGGAVAAWAGKPDRPLAYSATMNRLVELPGVKLLEARWGWMPRRGADYYPSDRCCVTESEDYMCRETYEPMNDPCMMLHLRDAEGECWVSVPVGSALEVGRAGIVKVVDHLDYYPKREG